MPATDDTATVTAEAEQPLFRPKSARAHVSATQSTGLEPLATASEPDSSR